MNTDEIINILLVDDKPENLLALEAIIDRDEYNLIKAYSGEEALKHLLKYDFAAILLDVQMPGMDGIKTAQIIKAREKTKNIPILFITANNMESEHIFMGYSAGAIDYILKPFDPFILKSKVDGFVDIYRMKQQLVQQTRILEEKTAALETMNKELSYTTEKLRQSEAMANVIRDTSLDSMLVLKQNGSILQVNQTVEKMFQYAEKDLIGIHIFQLFIEGSAHQYLSYVLENLSVSLRESEIKELTAIRNDGSEFPVEVQIGKRMINGNFIIACTIRDISERKQQEELIKHMAYHDSLTDLSNKRYFNKQLTELLLHAKNVNEPFAVMYLDLDHFKNINDSLGHLIGDKLLKEVANRLQKNVRKQDFIARVGGDEFNILLPSTDREGALKVVENLMDSFEEPFYIDHYELYMTTCIGLSIFPYDGEDSITLIKNADAALYRAKHQGRNNYRIYHSGMNVKSYRIFMMQNDLRKALNKNEFKLVYKPRIDIDSGEMKSVESFIHWEHPSWGTILPHEFIPLAEETGTMIEIGNWAIREVCRQLNEWKLKELKPFKVSIELTSQQFLQKDLVESIKNIIDETRIDPSLIDIEVTERILLENETFIVQVLKDLKHLGVGITLNNYGSGHLSMYYLRQFPLDRLKLDRKLIQGISHDDSDVSILTSTIIPLSHKLGLKVVASGVETEEQLRSLRHYQCHEIQGKLFSPPVDAKALENLLVDKVNDFAALTKGLKESFKNQPVKHESSMEKTFEQRKNFLLEALQQTKETYSLSTREVDVFELILAGYTNKDIAQKLFISEHTVKNHITRIFHKLGVNDRVQAIALVFQLSNRVEDSD